MGLNTESRTKSASMNAMSAIMNKIALLLIAFVSRKIFIKYIGIDYLGINGLFSNVLTLLSMADLGVGIAMNVSLYKPIAEKDFIKISALLNYFKEVYRIIAVAITIIGCGLMPFLKYIVNMDNNIPHLYLYYVIFVLKNTASYLFIYKSSILRADQKSYVINRLEIVIDFTRMIIQIIGVLAFKNYLLYIIVDVIAVIIHNIVISAVVDREYSFIDETARLNKKEKKSIFEDISSIFQYKIAWSLLNGTDNILMSIIVGTVYVGLYSNYYMVTSALELLVALIFNSLTASVGNMVATESAERRYTTFKSMQMVSYWICGNITIGVLFLIQDFISIIFGNEFQLDKLTVIAIVLNLFFSTCMRPVWTFREGTGMYKQIRYVMLVTAVVNLILSIVLGKLIGLSGIIFATSISKFVTYFWYEPKILFNKVFEKSVKKYFKSYLDNSVVTFVCIIICFFAINKLVGHTIFQWLIKAFICISIINAIYLIRYYKTDEFKEIKNKIVYLLGR